MSKWKVSSAEDMKTYVDVVVDVVVVVGVVEVVVVVGVVDVLKQF